MSQSHNPTDTQALLQSMLQRLKLQSGREGLQTPVPITTAPTWGQDGGKGASDLQNVNNSPVNGFGTNGVPSKEFGIPTADSNFGLKGGEIQQVDRGLVSFPTQKDNTDGDTGENRGPGIAQTRTGQLFPAVSLKDADITSSERTDGDRMSSVMTDNKDAATNMGQNQDQDQGFTPKVFAWSLKPADAGSQEGNMLQVGNGGFGALAQSKDMQIVPANSSMRRKQRSSENKTKRWTQKIKERWRDRPGSFGKKGREEELREISPQNQLLTAETLVNTSNKEERTLSSPDSGDPSKPPLTQTEDSTNEAYTRSTGDFEFGLGSFSLLDEIVTGQEWAKFLTPNLLAASTNQRASEELKAPPNPYDSSQSSLFVNHQGGVNNRWSFRGTETSAGSDVSMAQISPDAFQPVSMDVMEVKQQPDVHRQTDQSEPMEHVHIHSDMQSGDRGQGQQPRPPSFVQPADILKNSVMKNRLSLNRKRQHQSAERRDDRPQTDKISDAKEADREGPISSLSPRSSNMMEETGESQHDNVMPLYSGNSPISPSSSTPFSPAPKGVLRHSISQDSVSSMEVVTKRRRVEENRRVRFSEEVVTIVPPELDLDASDSEEESGGEEDSVIEECEVEQAAVEEVAPARRPALPAWIRALKRRNMGRKHR